MAIQAEAWLVRIIVRFHFLGICLVSSYSHKVLVFFLTGKLKRKVPRGGRYEGVFRSPQAPMKFDGCVRATKNFEQARVCSQRKFWCMSDISGRETEAYYYLAECYVNPTVRVIKKNHIWATSCKNLTSKYCGLWIVSSCDLFGDLDHEGAVATDSEVHVWFGVLETRRDQTCPLADRCLCLIGVMEAERMHGCLFSVIIVHFSYRGCVWCWDSRVLG